MQKEGICNSAAKQNYCRSTAKLLPEISKDLRVEPSLLKLNRKEETMRKTAKKNNKVRLVALEKFG